MTAPGKIVWSLLGAVSMAFHLSLIFSGLVPNLLSRPAHMALAAPWALILMARNRAERTSGYVLSAAAILMCGYIIWFRDPLGDQYGYLANNLQLIVAVGLILVVLEMARRCISWPLPLVAIIALAYGLLGQHLPGEFGHPGMPLYSFMGAMTITEAGLWGKLTSISVNVVAIFVIFGAVLNAGEAGQGFMNLAMAAAGRLKGGAAKVSVLSSALFGSISGSASANVASTGAVTLPAMRKLGYPKTLAGAVEAVASSGGQIMPPLMGAGAFVMVELTGVPYSGIIAAAILPAFLYFLTCWVGINAFARRHALRAIDRNDLPPTKTVIITTLFFAVPFAVLLERMFNGGFTPQYAACVATLVAGVLLFFDAGMKPSLRRFLARVPDACLNAGRQIAVIASIILCASLVIGVLGLTGLGVKITSLILSGSGGSLWPALILTALACLILGMEVPTTAAYVICVSVAGPALQQLGLPLLTAHLFVFWFALLSTITPPVCGAVFISAGMIGENWLRVALSAMALGVGLYLVPLGMVANPALIKLETDMTGALIAFLTMAAGLSAISFGIIAPVAPAVRGALIAAGFAVIFFLPYLF